MTFPESLSEQQRPITHPVVMAVGNTALAPTRQRRAENDSRAENARQALQESLDLREQGHADD
jgi:hypothetical protein